MQVCGLTPSTLCPFKWATWCLSITLLDCLVINPLFSLKRTFLKLFKLFFGRGSVPSSLGLSRKKLLIKTKLFPIRSDTQSFYLHGREVTNKNSFSQTTQQHTIPGVWQSRPGLRVAASSPSRTSDSDRCREILELYLKFLHCRMSKSAVILKFNYGKYLS